MSAEDSVVTAAGISIPMDEITRNTDSTAPDLSSTLIFT